MANDSNKKREKAVKDTTPETTRLNKFIAASGLCSRREADEMISSGKIKVNGNTVTELGTKIGPKDLVTFGKKKIEAKRSFVYILLNKPKGFICTASDDRGRQTVLDLIEGATKERVFPVGRLDAASTGLLLLTDDGELTNKLTHPSSGTKKIYAVSLDKPLAKQDMQDILDGKVELEDGFAEFDEMAYTDEEDKKEIGIGLHGGRNRIIRRTFEKLGYDVKKLDRVTFSLLTKKELPRGKWRFLSEKEVRILKTGR